MSDFFASNRSATASPARSRWSRNLAALGLSALLAACAGMAPPGGTGSAAGSGAVIAPNANLLVQGIPPIPASLAAQVDKYTDFRGHGFVTWHPTKAEMIVSHRAPGSSVNHLFRLAAPMGKLEALTDGPDPVSSAHYEPKEGRFLIYSQARGGNEVSQLYRLDLPSRQSTLLTNPDERHSFETWFSRSGRFLFSSVPLDRTARGGTRSTVSTVLRSMDPMNPADIKVMAELPGTGWNAGTLSKDEKTLIVNRYISANESQVWLLDVESGQRRQVLPAPGSNVRGVHGATRFLPDGSGLLVATDRFGEFRELATFDFKSGELKRITGHIPWDVAGAAMSYDGKLLAASVNVDGKDEPRFFDPARNWAERSYKGLPEGSVGAMRFHKKQPLAAFGVNGAKGPGQIYTLDAASGKVTQWTKAYAHPDVDTASFTEQQIIRWKSFDGRTISGLISRPPAKFTGKRPVLINIHGGPEAQAKVGFLARNQYYVQELGVALIQPNVRGSTGYGKTFVALDNGRLREDSVKDIGALLDWIAQQPDLDASRVLVTGGSYGGYMSLAVATHYAERIAGNIDVVGISHFVTFLETTESYRRDLRRVEYGDERDPAMREFLHSISPLTNAHKIKKPMFVVQGKNDPRVPWTEAEQIVAKARANGTPVWYLRAENEGHGFARKENADFQFYATILFMRETILK
jgi:dipeptidyl aminopeptidase/acylaminoacyl peptidase